MGGNVISTARAVETFESLSDTQQMVSKAAAASAAALLLYKLIGPKFAVSQGARALATRQQVVAITGCDSGLGLSMAKWAADAGFIVVAGCLSAEGEGATVLRAASPRIFIQQIDVTVQEDVAMYAERVGLVVKEFDADLYAWVPNAAIMVVGENFWQPHELKLHQMNVNFWGMVNCTEALEPLLLEYKTKMIAVTSDCAEIALPKYPLYTASKGAAELWARAIRLELQKHGIVVTCFRPGSFPDASRLMYAIRPHTEKMKIHLTAKTTNRFHFENFEKCTAYYEKRFPVATVPPIQVMQDRIIRDGFLHVLLWDTKNVPIYEVDNWKSGLFKCLLKKLPTKMSDKLMLKVLESYDK